MDDVWKSYLSAVLIVLTVAKASVGQCVDLEYLTKSKVDELHAQFANAKSRLPDESTQYTCEMFGVRTRLQVQRDVPLYSWHRGQSGNTAVNSGEMPIVEYKITDGQLTGTHAKGYVDQVRWMSDGTQISRLALPDKDGTVLSYSVCKPRLDTSKTKAS